MKWALVAAGAKDLARPAEKLSVAQSVGACSAVACLIIVAHRLGLLLHLIVSAFFFMRRNSSLCYGLHLGSLVLRHYSQEHEFGRCAYMF